MQSIGDHSAAEASLHYHSAMIASVAGKQMPSKDSPSSLCMQEE